MYLPSCRSDTLSLPLPQASSNFRAIIQRYIANSSLQFHRKGMPRLEIPTMALEPNLWGTLPKELLHLVFARLPVVRIGQLRVLSKEWKRNVDCKDSEFNQVFDATVHLNMFGLLSWRSLAGTGNIYDVQARKWHVYETDADFGKVETWAGADGGLVCFVSKWKWRDNEPGFCYVMNPLTWRQRKQLPPLLCMGAEKSNTLVTLVRMVKLSVDRNTKEYKVFVVGCIENGGGDFFAQVYDSHLKEWTVVEATHGRIIGWDYLRFLSCLKFRRSLYVYNCAEGTLQRFNGTDIATGFEVEPGCCVLLEDHLFVLHKEASSSPPDLLEDVESMLPKYCISEFHLPKKTTTWVKLGVRSCSPCKCTFHKPHNFVHLRLLGCNGFLLVYGDGSECSWLYNLSTCEWRTIRAFGYPVNLRMMCTISWSAMA